MYSYQDHIRGMIEPDPTKNPDAVICYLGSYREKMIVNYDPYEDFFQKREMPADWDWDQFDDVLSYWCYYGIIPETKEVQAEFVFSHVASENMGILIALRNLEWDDFDDAPPLGNLLSDKYMSLWNIGIELDVDLQAYVVDERTYTIIIEQELTYLLSRKYVWCWSLKEYHFSDLLEAIDILKSIDREKAVYYWTELLAVIADFSMNIRILKSHPGLFEYIRNNDLTRDLGVSITLGEYEEFLYKQTNQ